MKRLLIIPMLLVSSVVGACKSYDECMDLYGQKSAPWPKTDEQRDLAVKRAIAFKLDEISKKLGDPNKFSINCKCDCPDPPSFDHTGEDGWKKCPDGSMHMTNNYNE